MRAAKPGIDDEMPARLAGLGALILGRTCLGPSGVPGRMNAGGAGGGEEPPYHTRLRVDPSILALAAYVGGTDFRS